MTQHLQGAARQELLDDVRNLYALGLTIREVAEQTGYSFGATRAQLLAAGVTLRPKHGGRARERQSDPLSVVCPVCGHVAGKPCVQFGYARPRAPHLKRRHAAEAAAQ
jgi:hypothetical protein